MLSPANAGGTHNSAETGKTTLARGKTAHSDRYRKQGHLTKTGAKLQNSVSHSFLGAIPISLPKILAYY
jgi:hypothetical protein